MSNFATEYNRVKTNIENAYIECNNKGATMPKNQNSNNLADTIASITGGTNAATLVYTTYTDTLNPVPTSLTYTIQSTDVSNYKYLIAIIIAANDKGSIMSTDMTSTATLNKYMTNATANNGYGNQSVTCGIVTNFTNGDTITGTGNNLFTGRLIILGY